MVTKADINMRFVKAIESLLQDKGLTKTGVAQSLGIKPAKFSEILNFRMNVGTETIALLCDLYSFNPTWILLGEGSMLTAGNIKGVPSPQLLYQNCQIFHWTQTEFAKCFSLSCRIKTCERMSWQRKSGNSRLRSVN